MYKFTKAVELLKNGTLTNKQNSDEFIIQEPFVWYLNYHTKTGKIEIPKGFKTDLGSIPKIFRPFFSRNRFVAYILHDFLYSKRGTYFIPPNYYSITRKEADEILKEALIIEGCPKIKAWCIYIAVRIGGWTRW